MFLVLFILLTLTCKLNYIGGVDRNELLQSFETKLLRTRPVAYMFSHFTHMVMIPIQNNKEIRSIFRNFEQGYLRISIMMSVMTMIMTLTLTMMMAMTMSPMTMMMIMILIIIMTMMMTMTMTMTMMMTMTMTMMVMMMMKMMKMIMMTTMIMVEKTSWRYTKIVK